MKSVFVFVLCSFLREGGYGQVRLSVCGFAGSSPPP